MAFVDIQTRQELEEFLGASNGGPAILLKHSNSCGISARAYRDLSQVNQPVGVITVQNARDVSDEIERRYNLPHETPQALIVKNNELLWNASHGRVNANAIEQAMEASTKRIVE